MKWIRQLSKSSNIITIPNSCVDNLLYVSEISFQTYAEAKFVQILNTQKN